MIASIQIYPSIEQNSNLIVTEDIYFWTVCQYIPDSIAYFILSPIQSCFFLCKLPNFLIIKCDGKTILQDEVNKLMSTTLRERERDIIRLYYGLDNETLTWEDISKRCAEMLLYFCLPKNIINNMNHSLIKGVLE